MSAETTFYAYLAGAAGVTAIVGAGASARIYPDVIPQDKALPAVAYARMVTEPVSTVHSGAQVAELVTMQAQCWAATRTAADALADAATAALAAQGEPPVARSVLFDDETGAFGTAVDFRLLINP
jgi:hypothetical protein